jgi:adhesin transport system membrane fusion protein
MLNISNNSINHLVERTNLRSFDKVNQRWNPVKLPGLLLILSFLVLGAMFLPWTQNVRAKGVVTTLQPDQRPQTIQSVIAGRIEQWYVREGDFVERGDTIMRISEIKEDYFDPDLLPRLQAQIGAKQQAAASYSEKADALARQLEALEEASDLKLQQAQNKYEQAQFKLQSDSIDLVAERINFRIAEEQYIRMQALYQQGLKSLTDLEQREMKMQEARAKLISQENKVSVSRAQMINAQTEIAAIRAEYADKIAKTQSERFTALSSLYDAEGQITKMQNQFTNYEMRNTLYYITSPQTGYVTQSIQSGLGETIKEGTEIVSIMPATYDLAVSIYVRPLDLPLLNRGEHVRIQFDGWPAIVFSGWPNASQGTFGGHIVAIDNFPDEKGQFRVLIAPDPNDTPWPDALRVGGGVQAMALLQDVPVWYELWRQVNGFPPDYYQPDMEEEKPKERKPKYK